MIHWEYAHLFVGMRGNDHVVAGINGEPQDVVHNAQAPWDVLNRMGADGWELVAVVPTSPLQTIRSGHEELAEGYWMFYLKRPLPAT